jgi:hypothetical protein
LLSAVLAEQKRRGRKLPASDETSRKRRVEAVATRVMKCWGVAFRAAPLNTQATNRDRQTSRRLMMSSILLITSSIDLVCAGGTTSKEQSHLEQCQK